MNVAAAAAAAKSSLLVDPPTAAAYETQRAVATMIKVELFG